MNGTACADCVTLFAIHEMANSLARLKLKLRRVNSAHDWSAHETPSHSHSDSRVSVAGWRDLWRVYFTDALSAKIKDDLCCIDAAYKLQTKRMSNKAIIKTPKNQSDLKLVRISRDVGNKLVKFIADHSAQGRILYHRIDAGRFIDQAILEKMAREQKK
jgi:hypothetical protein